MMEQVHPKKDCGAWTHDGEEKTSKKEGAEEEKNAKQGPTERILYALVPSCTTFCLTRGTEYNLQW